MKPLAAAASAAGKANSSSSAAAAAGGSSGQEGLVLRCGQCQQVFCYDCDAFVHETLHNCPGCECGVGQSEPTAAAGAANGIGH